MRCAQFLRRYSAWVDTRHAVPAARSLLEHLQGCPRCSAFVRSIDLLDEACAKARAARIAFPGAEAEREAALTLADLVVAESRKQGILASPQGFALVLAGLLGAGLLAVLLVRLFRPEWGILLEVVLIAGSLAALGLELILYAPPADLSEPLPEKAQAGPA